MPYVPNTPDTAQRGMVYTSIWVSAAASVITFANAFLGWSNFFLALAFGASVGGLIVAAMASNTDEFFQSRCHIGLRWLVAGLAVYLFVLFLLNIGDVAYSAGQRLSYPEGATQNTTTAQLLVDARVLGSGLALLFYAGYAVAVLREGR